jgi:transmembrane sensor
MQNKRLWVLFSRQLSGEATSDELKELQDLLKQHPDKQYMLDILRNYFNLHTPADNGNKDTNFEEKFRKIISSAEEQS